MRYLNVPGVFLSVHLLSCAQVPAPEDLWKAAGESIALQRKAAGSMAQSIAAQRASTGRQVRDATTFFLLPAALPTLVSSASVPSVACAPMSASELDGLILPAASREELQPQLLRSVVAQESAAYPCAVSSKGAMGLMQLMPATAAELGVQNPFDPQANVDAGARLLKKLLTRYGNIPMALGAYNAGTTKVDRSGGIPDIPETIDYVDRILSSLAAGSDK